MVDFSLHKDIKQQENSTVSKISTDPQTNMVSAVQEISKDFPPEIAELLERGAHFGHQKSRLHPSMLPFIFGVRNTIHIIDVQDTYVKIKEAGEFLEKQAQEGKVILFVGTKMPLRSVVRKSAEGCGMPYIVERWAGGTLTNWKTISERVERFRGLEAKKKSPDWDKYTKYERLGMEEELARMELQWGGIKDIRKVPDVLVVVDMQENHLAVKEARRVGIPIVAIADTNVNVHLVDYPIPANDDSIKAVEYILEKLKKAILKGSKESGGDGDGK